MTEPGADDDIDGSLTTWQGARRESMRRWAALPLERIIATLEEMEALSLALGSRDGTQEPGRAPGDLPADPPRRGETL